LQAQWLTSDQATPATTPTASVAEIARMVRKDSIHSAASPTTAKVVPGPETPLAHFERHLEEWQACKGHPETFMQKELRTAEEDLESLKQNTPKIERAVKEFQQQHVAAQEELERMEQFQKDSDAAAEKAGVHLGRHKAIREEWKAFPMKHVQLAWAENNRCSEAWQKAVNDRATAQKCEIETKQKIEKILEGRKELETFGRLYKSSLPSSNGA
jgi:small-conductance mechanosensitive channel